jgi:serine/threonine protein kinase/tetratricopeptide (TPR) repeat protein
MSNPEDHPPRIEEGWSRDHAQPDDRTVPYGSPNQAAASWELPSDRYRVLSEIARGGMGVVLRAYDVSFGRLLAIKLLLPHKEPRPGDERRLLEEARITGQLQHPGIPPVYEVGRLPDGRPFFSMKLIEGRTLADLFAERPTSHTDQPRFLKAFEQIAQTLAYAHAQGVMHRDLKPSNIMVGAFGEVQVMDWGLAKRLRDGAIAGNELVPPSAPRVAAVGPMVLPSVPVPDNIDRDTPRPPQQTAAMPPTTPRPHADRLTQAGQVLGTPAFMSPEQARGDIDSLDERADVFGLGAILCVLLTGAPPYHGQKGPAPLRRAATADLTEALQRLEACGADAQLIELCQECLQPDASKRPPNGGVVARRISAYLVSVQEQLEKTRLARAAAEVKAREERKRRRLAVSLALAVVLLVVGLGAVGTWYTRDQARREAETAARSDYLEREVATAVGEAERQRQELHWRLKDEVQAAQLLSDPKDWNGLLESARGACRRAEVLAAGGRDMLSPELSSRLAALTGKLQADERERRLVFELDRIRLESSGVVQGQVQLGPAAPRLAQVFRDAGYDIGQDIPEELGARMRQSAIRLPLVAGLDFWALAVDDMKLRGRLLEVARAADSDLWRDRFRQVDVWKDLSKLRALAAKADCAHQSPQLLAALGQCLGWAGGDPSDLLRRALIHHPRDFWLHFQLGVSSKQGVEQAGAFRAALAVRPDAATAHYNLGVVLQSERPFDEAIACYQRAIALDPKYAAAHNNLGLLYEEQNKLAEASTCYRNAIAADANSAMAHLNLGSLFQAQGNLSEAVACYHRALKIDPKSAAGHNNLGTALRAQHKLDEAVACFQSAIKIDPNHAMAWCNLGHALRELDRYEEALPAFRRGHELGSQQRGWSYSSAFWVLETQQWIALDKKLAAFERGEGPPGAREQLAVAEFCLMTKKRYAAAARFYSAAFASDPKLADDLSAARRYNAACAAIRAANGEGRDAADLDRSQRHRCRSQALGWLTAELQAWSVRVEKEPDSHAVAAKTLHHWQDDPDLISVRDVMTLADLPTDERASWRRLWAAVAALRARAGKGTP